MMSTAAPAKMASIRLTHFDREVYEPAEVRPRRSRSVRRCITLTQLSSAQLRSSRTSVGFGV
jgi:hypothetical protein